MDPNQSHIGKARLFLFNTSNKDAAVRSLLTCASSLVGKRNKGHQTRFP